MILLLFSRNAAYHYIYIQYILVSLMCHFVAFGSRLNVDGHRDTQTLTHKSAKRDRLTPESFLVSVKDEEGAVV